MKATHSVRIGRVRRRSISPERKEYQPSPKVRSITVQQQPDYQSAHQQFLEKQINHTTPMNNELHDKKYDSTPRTPRHVRLNDTNQVNNSNQPDSNISSLPSFVPIAKQPPTTNLHEISSKTKWSMRKKVVVGVSALLLLSIIIIVPTVLGILLTRPTATTTTTTTVSPTVVSAYWSFDAVTTDFYGVYNGTLINGATYTSVSSNQPYFGNGRALSLNSAGSQSFLVSTPFLDLTYTSFTVEAWIFLLTNYTGDRGVFGQCQCSTCANQCLYFTVRGNSLYMSFTLNDLAGSLTLSINTWYHVAFVYNYQTQQQLLYLNGVQDKIKSNAQPYQGTNGTIQIGSAQVLLTLNYFNGYIDNLKVVTRAKSATEILRDASLIAYYSFDLPSPNLDNGPNGLNGTLVYAATVTGRVNEALRFTGTSSYFQAYGFYQTVLSVNSNRPFSISLWINPSVNTYCTFVQVSTLQSGGSCTNLLGVWSNSANLAGQIAAQGYAWPTIIGPYVTVNTWTHISWAYSSISGYSLYVNGILFGSTGASSYTATGFITWLQIGYSFSCSSSYLPNIAYQGSIDEIYVYNRELAASEVYALANP